MQGVVKFWKYLKDVVEIIDLFGFGGKLKKILKKKPVSSSLLTANTVF